MATVSQTEKVNNNNHNRHNNIMLKTFRTSILA